MLKLCKGHGLILKNPVDASLLLIWQFKLRDRASLFASALEKLADSADFLVEPIIFNLLLLLELNIRD